MVRQMQLLGRVFVLLLGVALLGLSSCGKQEPRELPDVMDFSPIEFRISVFNAKGEDLVNPEHPNTIVKQGLKVVMAGKTYELKDRNLRTYLPQFYGLVVIPPFEVGHPWEINFGEFDGEEDGTREVTLIWPDGTQNVLKYTNKVNWGQWRKGGELVERHFYLDDNRLSPDFYRYRFVKG